MPSQPDPTAGQPWFCAPHLYSICIFLALVCFLGGRSWAAADTVLDRKVAFHIAAQPLDTALIEFSKQSGVTVSVAASSIHAVQAPAVSGTFAPGAALTELLDASGLRYEAFGATVTVLPIATQSDEGSRQIHISTLDSTVGNTAGDLDGPSNESESEKGDRHEGRVAKPLDEVIVTGTLIHGAAPVGSPLKIYTRDDIDQSGAGTLAEFARQMPENFSGTDTIANQLSNAKLGAGAGTTSGNSYNGSAFNLRGLGPLATLTLLNGQRMAPGGNDGSFVDISAIPVSAIDHIEVLADGASAIYGADAVGGVVNIITRKNFDGAESQIRYGTATDGGAETVAASQLLGKAWQSGNVFVNYTYTHNGGLDASDRTYIPYQGGPYLLISADHRNSILVSANQSLDNATSISGFATYSRGGSTHPTAFADDFETGSTTVWGSTEQTGVSLTLDHQFSEDRHTSITGNYSRVRQRANNYGDATIPSIPLTLQSEATQTATTKDASVDVLADGKILSLYGGDVKGALGASYRTEEFANSTGGSSSGVPLPSKMLSLQRHVASAFAELRIPVFTEKNAIPLVESLEISAAGRFDHYDDFGSAASPKFGVKWSLGSGIDLRSTFGRSFRAPLLNQIAVPEASFATNIGIPDTLIVGGGNSNLGPERAKTVTAGFDIRPSLAPSLLLSAQYYNINYRDRIDTPPYAQYSQIFGPSLAPFVNLHPSLSEVQNYFYSPGFVTDQSGLGPNGVTAIFDDRVTNIAISKQSGVEFDVGYRERTDIGNLSMAATITRVLRYELQTVPSVPFITLVDTFAEPTKWRARGNVAWSQAAFTAALTVNYTSAYQNTLFNPAQAIDSWTTGDLYLSYNLRSSRTAILDGTTIALAVNNITNERPPHVDIPTAIGAPVIPYDPANASPVGRLISMTITKQW